MKAPEQLKSALLRFASGAGQMFARDGAGIRGCAIKAGANDKLAKNGAHYVKADKPGAAAVAGRRRRKHEDIEEEAN